MRLWELNKKYKKEALPLKLVDASLASLVEIIFGDVETPKYQGGKIILPNKPDMEVFNLSTDIVARDPGSEFPWWVRMYGGIPLVFDISDNVFNALHRHNDQEAFFHEALGSKELRVVERLTGDVTNLVGNIHIHPLGDLFDKIRDSVRLIQKEPLKTQKLNNSECGKFQNVKLTGDFVNTKIKGMSCFIFKGILVFMAPGGIMIKTKVPDFSLLSQAVGTTLVKPEKAEVTAGVGGAAG